MDTKSQYGTLTLITILENYGWYMLISVILVIYFINLLKPKINKFYTLKSEQEYIAKYHKDPDRFVQRLEAQRKRVEYLQEQYQKDAELHEEKLKEREAKKLKEIAEKYENIDAGKKLGSSKDERTKSLKTEYHPLMRNSSGSYRPVRKSPCSGGGCGR